MPTKAELTQDLKVTKETLDRICEVLANEEWAYPERVGRCAVTASYALKKLGDDKWANHFEEAYSSRDARRTVQFPKPLLKVA